MPTGSVSTTVIVPEVDALPAFVTVSVYLASACPYNQGPLLALAIARLGMPGSGPQLELSSVVPARLAVLNAPLPVLPVHANAATFGFAMNAIATV